MAPITLLTIIAYQDTFEDANDSSRLDTLSPNASTRSLTQRPLSTSSIPEEAEATEQVNIQKNEKTLEDDLQKNDTKLEEKANASPPPVPRRPEKISLDNGTLDNVDLENNSAGRYHHRAP